MSQNNNDMDKHTEDTKSNEEVTVPMENNTDNECDINNINDLLGSLGNPEELGDLFKKFTNSFSNLETNDDNNENEHDDISEQDLDFDLDKYLIGKNGQNICDVLTDIKDQLTIISCQMAK
tara:strand:- start:15569 stop:15931 length:363 start_codon:yes stop_codon:yes gene_type:complete